MDQDKTKTIYLMGIGGIAMGTLASMLKAEGFNIIGSDQKLYPPMSTHLERLQVPVFQGYDAENLKKARPDLVIIGNVIRRDNPEAQFVLESHLPYMSMAEAITHFFLASRTSIVVAGTHGKSTTSALMSWVLDSAGLDPSALIGGFMKNWDASFRLGSGKYMVVEGDEYDTAFFDKKAKFLHYRPQIGIVTSVEFDHADIFSDFEAVFQAFTEFVATLPGNGNLVVNGDDPHCRMLAEYFAGRVTTYGQKNGSNYQLLDVTYLPEEVKFTYRNPEGDALSLVSNMAGFHNVSNTLAVVAVSSLLGLTNGQIQDALLTFKGVKRRQDCLGSANGVLVVDDFAHHPTAVKQTICAMRRYYPGRRLIALFEPRTNSSRRNIFQKDYERAFDDADLICIKQPPDLEKIPVGERLDTPKLAEGIGQRGKEVHCFEQSDDLLVFLMRQCRSGDLVLSMSNGSFDQVPQRLFSALQTIAEQTHGSPLTARHSGEDR